MHQLYDTFNKKDFVPEGETSKIYIPYSKQDI